MKLYTERDSYKLYEGNMLDMLEVIEPNSIDAIVTDPPYELNFMNKGWDNSGIAFQKSTWEKCFEVLKPGGHLLAFGGSRTFHRIACAIEDAGFEIRDTIMYLYGSGFPKSFNIGFAIDKKNGIERKIVGYEKTTMPDFRDVGKKQKEISGIDKLTFGQIENSERKAQPIYEAQNEWAGWGTQLKPAYEPVIVARKPVKKSIVDNVLKYGVGGINIDECKIGNEKLEGGTMPKMSGGELGVCNFKTIGADRVDREDSIGRFPANVIHDGSEEAISGFPNTNSNYNDNGKHEENIHRENADILKYGYKARIDSGFNDEGSASRYFYCAKASKKDRDEGLDEFEEKKASMLATNDNIDENGNFTGMLAGRNTMKKNIHPTVKPCELMQYLVRLVAPRGATILDCFNGSGSTGKAVMWENRERNADYKYIGIELTEEYLPISKARIDYVLDKRDQEIKQVEKNENGVEETKTYKIQTIFDF